MDQPTSCPGVAELDALCHDASRRGVPVDLIGHSREGRAIRCISPPSRGRVDVLVVGTPHPNEPIGGRTVQVLLEMALSRAPALAALPSLRWHFIPTIEPDGLALNDGWLANPHDLAAYVRGFYRPAFRHQAEYAFPLHTQSHRFEACTPETRAWMAAIDRIRPALMVSLHNADHGGAFNVLSRPLGGLAAELSRQARRHGIDLDEAGDPLAESAVLAPGVFQADDFRALVEQAPGVWQAGDSSFGYAARHGTLGLVPEVPRWQEAVVEGQLPSSDAERGLAGLYDATVALVADAQGLADSKEEADLLWAAIAEGAPVLRRLLAIQAGQDSRPLPATAVRLQRRRLRLLPLRTLGMLVRWCQAQEASDAGTAARQAMARIRARASELIEGELGDASLSDGMLPVPLKAAVAVQLQAILSAAAAVATKSPAMPLRVGRS